MDKKYKTRDGRDVRVLCVDADNEHFPVIGIVHGYACNFSRDGKWSETMSASGDSPRDLIEQPEEKTVWLEIFRYKHWGDNRNIQIEAHNSLDELEAAVVKQQFGYQCVAIKKITYTEGEGIE